MTSPFLPIFTSSPNLVSGHAGAGATGLRYDSSEHGGEPVTFLDVLGGLQPALQDEASTAFLSLEDQAILPETILTDQEILDELAAQGLILVEQQGTVSLQLASTPVSNGEATQHILNAVNALKTPSGTVANQDGGHAFIRQVRALLHRLNHAGTPAGTSIDPAQSEVIREIATPHQDSPFPAHIATRSSVRTGVVPQPVIASDGLVAPLVRETSQGTHEPRLLPPSVPAISPSLDAGAITQRLAVGGEGSGTYSHTIVENPIGGTVLQASRDDLTQGLSRVQGEGKTLEPFYISLGAESGSGQGGHGLPFGHHAGTGHGHNFDSSSGSPVITSQGQLIVKGGSFDERLQLLNTPVPHRLQIDVQLSEAARMQVDVGVQQRQVYAGVLLDNPVLRALASQNVQQLEGQLGQADMELEEFDVHEETPHFHEQFGNESSGNHGHTGRFSESGGDVAHSHGLEHVRTTIQQDRGWHLVA
ncbi:MAG: hypothetical protein NPIRA02_03930 [Nitrospirales bacterium]|nr:MAG: hypothetical protein NPIRA02_03930 [Nitrospirales bacterium]